MKLERVNYRLVLLAILLLAVVVIPAGAATEPAQPAKSLPAAVNGTITVTTSAAGTFTYVGFAHTITVTDADLNVTPGPGNDFATVVVRNITGAVEGNLQLPETTTAGIFRLVWTNTDLAGGVNLGIVPNQQIRFRYTDAVPAGGGGPVERDVTFNTIATTATIDVTPLQAPAASTLTITIVDADRNLNSGGGNDTINFRVRNNADAPAANVVLQMSESATPGTFVGTLENTSPVIDDNGGTIPSVVGDQLRIMYTDTFDSFGNQQVVFVLHTLTGTDGTLAVTPNTNISGRAVITITVVDADENLTAGPSNDTALVRVIPATGDANGIDVNLDETTTAGTFRGTFDLASFTGANALNFGDTGRVRYRDLGRADGTTNFDIFVDLTITAVDAVLNAPPSSDIPNGFTVTVNDADENDTAGGSNDNVTVQVELAQCTDTVTCGATSNLPLAETATAGVFSAATGDLSVPFPTIAIGELVRVRYVEPIGATGGVNILREVFVNVVQGTDSTLTVSPTIVAPAGVFTVTITDADRNGTAGGSNDTVDFTVQNITQAGVLKTLTANETATAGVFTLSVATNDNSLNAKLGDRIEVIYTDPTPLGGGAPVQKKAYVDIRNVGQNATVEIIVTIPGRAATIRVSDPEAGTSGSVAVSVQNVTKGDAVETLNIAYSSSEGKFVGTLQTEYAIADDGAADGILNVVPGDIIQAGYVDSLNSSGASRTVTASATVQSRRAPTLFCDRGSTTNSPIWFAQYWNNTSLSGSPVASGDERDLNIDYQETSPARGFPADGWSARWSTTLTITEQAVYRFRVTVDDGARLSLNGNAIIDQFSNGPERTFQSDQLLAPGDYAVALEYFEGDGDARIRVECYFVANPVLAIDRDGNTITVAPGSVNFGDAIAHITTGRINVRANPSVTAAWLGYVYIYQRYPILGITQDASWYLIDLKDGRSGWVAARYVKRYDNTPVQIFPNFASSESALPDVEVTGFATEEIKIRTAPRTGTQIGVVPQGGAFRILARTQSGAWYRINYDGFEGWVFAPYVELTNGTVQDLPRE